MAHVPSRKVKTSSVEALKVKDSIRRDMLEYGIQNNRELSIRYGRTPPVINKYQNQIYQELRKAYEQYGYHMASQLYARYDTVIRRAAVAFDRSQQNDETVITEYGKQECKDCKGTGFVGADPENGEWCERCDGDGIVVIENTTKKVRGQAGDPRFLKLIKDCLAEQCKLTGAYKTNPTVNVNMPNSTIDLSSLDNEKVLQIVAEGQRARLPNYDQGNVVDEGSKHKKEGG